MAKEKSSNKELLEQLLVDVNGILKYMTGLVHVKEMILEAAQQKEMIESVATGSEEMSSATEDISKFVQESTKVMSDVMDKATRGLGKIDNTFKILETNINDTVRVKDVMTEVVEETKRINEMVKIINSVAVQTKLLSLNATIEAARAGKHGKGFAVVADEVKNLALSTSQQASQIQEIVESLNSKMKNVSEEIDKVVETFDVSKVSIDDATSDIKNINNDMVVVGDRFIEISANIEEQTAASEEMSSSLMIINDKAVNLKEDSNKTGKEFFDISMEIDKIRIKIFDSGLNIKNTAMAELSITDHLMWKWRVYNMILGYVKLDVSKVGDHNGCRLGKWLHTLNTRKPEVSEIIGKISYPHSKIHEIAKSSIEEYENGNFNVAEEMLKEIEVHSNIVVTELEKLKNVV